MDPEAEHRARESWRRSASEWRHFWLATETAKEKKRSQRSSIFNTRTAIVHLRSSICDHHYYHRHHRMCWQFVCILLLISCQLILFVGRRFVSIVHQDTSVSVSSHIQVIPLFEFQALSTVTVCGHIHPSIHPSIPYNTLNHWSESHARLSITILMCYSYYGHSYCCCVIVVWLYTIQLWFDGCCGWWFYFRCCQATLNEVMSQK